MEFRRCYACQSNGTYYKDNRRQFYLFIWFIFNSSVDVGRTDMSVSIQQSMPKSVLIFKTFQGMFSSSPTIFATAEHYRSHLKHDAACTWLEGVSSSSFKICVRELQNFAGVHDAISVVSCIL